MLCGFGGDRPDRPDRLVSSGVISFDVSHFLTVSHIFSHFLTGSRSETIWRSRTDFSSWLGTWICPKLGPRSHVSRMAETSNLCQVTCAPLVHCHGLRVGQSFWIVKWWINSTLLDPREYPYPPYPSFGGLLDKRRAPMASSKYSESGSLEPWHFFWCTGTIILQEHNIAWNDAANGQCLLMI